MEENTFSIINKVRKPVPINGNRFLAFKDKVLGNKYSLSVIFIGIKTSRKLNRAYRKIDRPTDILSFPIDKKEGEIYINPNVAKKKSMVFDRNYSNYLEFLFIHGLVHLKGFDHGSRMESEEEKIRKVFNV